MEAQELVRLAEDVLVADRISERDPARSDLEFADLGVVGARTLSGERAERADRLRRVTETFWGEFDDPRFENHELIDAGDQVVVWFTLRGHGKQSGAETSWDV